MKRSTSVRAALAVLLAVSISAVEGASRSLQNPLSKTIELLSSLQAKITAEGEAENKAYKEYVEWCDEATTGLRNDIKTGETKKGKLEAKIDEASADIEASASKIEQLAASIAEDRAEVKNATIQRTKELEIFKANEAELMDVIETLGRAIGILEKEMQKNPAVLAQVDTTKVDSVIKGLEAVISAADFPIQDQQKLVALVQSGQQGTEEEDPEEEAEEEELGAPAAAAYKTHSTGIFDLLEDLKDKAETELSELRKAEATAKHNYDSLKQSLEDQIDADTKNMEEEKAEKAASEQEKATAEGELATTEEDLASDKKSYEATSNSCMQVAADHEASIKSRAEELNALKTAKEILTNTTAGAAEQTYSFLQVGSHLASRADLVSSELVTMVKRLAKEHHSAALAQLASRIAVVLKLGSSAGADPFVKVRALITDLIKKLEAEAEAEATEKAYCDEEMAKTETKKSELEAGIEKLTTKIDTSAAKSAELKEEVKELQAELAELARVQAEMDKVRSDTHEAYVAAKADLEAGLQGVQQALSVLRDYYANAGGDEGSTALVQQPEKPKFHKPAGGAGGSIISILEVVESDFSKDLATEEAEEADAQTEHEKLTQENKVTKATKEQDVKYKTQEHTTLDKSIAQLSGDRDTMSTELAAVMEYYKEIKERCVAKPETYEERKARREAEIAGLKEALSILETETATAFTQSYRKGGRKGAAFLGR